MTKLLEQALEIARNYGCASPGHLGKTRAVKLRYTLPALADLNSILDYISESSPRGAERVKRRIQRVTGLPSRE